MRLIVVAPTASDAWIVVERIPPGLLRLDHTTLRISDMPECELRVYTPADEATGEALHQLLATNRNQTSREPTPAP